MLISEFIERTGFRPTDEYYHTVIEAEYMKSLLNKDEWCKQWKKQGGLQKAYDAICKQAHSTVIDLETKVEGLTTERDTYKQLSEVAISKHDAEVAKNKSLIEFLIIQAEKWSATDLRDKAIELIGVKAYLRYKIENDINLWEIDKELLFENLK